jgi:plasmid stabilization system protein ParE
VTRRLRLSTEARREIVDAGRWYERHSPGVGSEFHDDLAASLVRIVENPEAWPLAPDGPPGLETRQTSLDRFPYRVVFSIGSDAIHVLAVAHLRREPGYWRGRLS